MGTFQADSPHREPRGGDWTGCVRGAFGVIGKKKEGQPFRVGPLRSTAVAVPRRCIFTIAQLSGVVNNFLQWCAFRRLRRFGFAALVPLRCAPAHGRAGGGLWALPLLPHRSRSSREAVRSGRTVAQPSALALVAVRACTFGGGGVFRAAALPGGRVVFRADAATGRSPWERRELHGSDGREKSPLTIPGEVW